MLGFRGLPLRTIAAPIRRSFAKGAKDAAKDAGKEAAPVAPKAAASGNHAPPMKVHGIVGRYAEATYVAASKVCPQFY
jgi:hypothetical protein